LLIFAIHPNLTHNINESFFEIDASLPPGMKNKSPRKKGGVKMLKIIKTIVHDKPALFCVLLVIAMLVVTPFYMNWAKEEGGEFITRTFSDGTTVTVEEVVYGVDVPIRIDYSYLSRREENPDALLTLQFDYPYLVPGLKLVGVNDERAVYELFPDHVQFTLTDWPRDNLLVAHFEYSSETVGIGVEPTGYRFDVNDYVTDDETVWELANSLDTLSDIPEWIYNNIQYQYLSEGAGQKMDYQTIAEGKGNCEDVAFLFYSLYQKMFPDREQAVSEGWSIGRGGRTARHAVNSVLLDGEWVVIEPSQNNHRYGLKDVLITPIFFPDDIRNDDKSGLGGQRVEGTDYLGGNVRINVAYDTPTLKVLHA
jgi:hypothetical protein